MGLINWWDLPGEHLSERLQNYIFQIPDAKTGRIVDAVVSPAVVKQRGETCKLASMAYAMSHVTDFLYLNDAK